MKSNLIYYRVTYYCHAISKTLIKVSQIADQRLQRTITIFQKAFLRKKETLSCCIHHPEHQTFLDNKYEFSPLNEVLGGVTALN